MSNITSDDNSASLSEEIGEPSPDPVEEESLHPVPELRAGTSSRPVRRHSSLPLSKRLACKSLHTACIVWMQKLYTCSNTLC